MQTRIITWTKLQKFEEFGQGLSKVGKHYFAFQHSKRNSEAWNKAQTSSSFGCQEPGPLSICCSSKGIGFLADIDHFIDKSPFKWAVPLWIYPSLTLLPALYVRLSSNPFWLKSHFSMAHLGTDHDCFQLRKSDKHSQTGLKTVKLHLEWVLS